MSRIIHRSLRGTLPEAVSGKGVTITDREGRRYIDASGGAAVSCLGQRPAQAAMDDPAHLRSSSTSSATRKRATML